jgi:choline-sulfatase
MGALDNHAFLPLSRPTYYQHLRKHGYQVGCVGKLDLAKPDGYNGREGRRPLAYAFGFTDPVECEGKMHAGRGDPPNGPYTSWLKEQDPALHKAFTDDYQSRRDQGAVGVLHDSVVPFGYCEDDYIGQRACQAIQTFSDEFPWHLFVSFVGPHNPFDPAPEYAEQWRSADMPEPIPWEPAGKPDRYARGREDYRDPALCKIARRQYTAYLEQIDFRIGELLATLEQRGELDSTYIVFAADHGEMLGDHGRYTKGVQYESSLRVPMIVSGPGISPGVSDALVELNDLNPTIRELAGLAPLPNSDARSVLPVASGKATQHRDFTFATHRGHLCLRDHQWKFIRGDDGQHELYDLVNDPNERQNVFEQHPDVVALWQQRAVDGLVEGGCNR